MRRARLTRVARPAAVPRPSSSWPCCCAVTACGVSHFPRSIVAFMLFQASILLLYFARMPALAQGAAHGGRARRPDADPRAPSTPTTWRSPSRSASSWRWRSGSISSSAWPASWTWATSPSSPWAPTPGRSSARPRPIRSSAAASFRCRRAGSSSSSSSAWASRRGAGILLGLPVLRLHGDYLAIVTLGFGEVIRVLANNLDKPINFTNGPKGITPDLAAADLLRAAAARPSASTRAPTSSIRSTSTSSCCSSSA